MAKNVSLTPAPEMVKDQSLIIAAMPAAVKGLADMATAQVKARSACLAFADSVKAVWGNLDVLAATSRKKDASDDMRAGHTVLKEAFLAETWGAEFAAWVNGAGVDKPRAPKRGQAVKPRLYWQQQKGNLWNKAGSGFVSKVLAFVEEDKVATEPGKAPNRKETGIDVSCRKDVNAAVKRIETAVKDSKDIPLHVDVAAFLALAKLALDAIEPGKKPRDRAAMALKALRAAKVLL
jgi:hypothetical protein